MNESPTAYRPDLDGLRAIAIVAVVVFHAFPGLLPGGFVGVDVFFVISGYLIARIIFADRRDGRFSFAGFYARRASRLFPALALVLAACMVYGWFILLPDEYQQLGAHVRGGALYISNFALNGEAGYFDVDAQLKPLQHLWSLAIEEQFYLAFPVLAVILYRRRVDFFALIAMLLVASFVANIVWIGFNPVETYFMPFTRAWELLVGVTLAQIGHFGWIGRDFRPVTWPRPKWADLAAVAGLAAIVLSAALLNTSFLFPGWWAVPPVLGTALLIAAGPAAWLNRAVLANPVAVFIGLISYPLYLWHWPLLSLARIVEGEALPFVHRVALVALALALAFATYRLVERPVRARARRQPIIAAAPVILLFVLGGVGQAIASGDVLPYASQLGVDRILAMTKEWRYPTADMKRLPLGRRNAWTKAGTNGSVLFLGDSNVEQYWPRFQSLLADAPQSYKSAFFLTEGGCPPISGVSESYHPNCRRFVERAHDLVEKNDIDTVVMAAQWWVYFSAGTYRLGGHTLAEPDGMRDGLAALEKDIAGWVAQKRRVYLVLDIPMGPEIDPKSMIERTFVSFSVRPITGITRAALETRYGTISQALRATAMRAGATVIDPLDFLCGPDGLCKATDDDGQPIYKDEGHLRPAYVQEHVQYLDAILRNGN